MVDTGLYEETQSSRQAASLSRRTKNCSSRSAHGHGTTINDIPGPKPARVHGLIPTSWSNEGEDDAPYSPGGEPVKKKAHLPPQSCP